MLRIDFEGGEPVSAEPFLSGFLVEQDGGYGYLGRLAGLAVGPDGALYVADDAQGVISRVAYGSETSAAAAAAVPNPILPPPPSEIGLALVEARAEAALPVRSAFEPGQPIPLAHAADGDNASPAVAWEAVEEAQSFVIIMDLSLIHI